MSDPASHQPGEKNGDPVLDGVVAFVPPVRVLVVGGRDRMRFLQALVAQDLDGLTPGDAVHGALTDDRGHAIADFHLYVLPEAVLLELPAGRAGEARAALDARIIADDVLTAWASGEVAAYEARDPSLLTLAFLKLDDEVSAVQLHEAAVVLSEPDVSVAFSAGGGRAEDDPALAEESVLATVPASRRAILRASRLGGIGFLHWPAGDRIAEFAAVARHGGVTTALSATQLDPLEIAAGRIAAPELAASRVWNELGIMSAVSLTKGCWMGQEIVRRVHVRGETRRVLRGVVLDVPHGVGWAGARLEDVAGIEAGVVTRAARIPVPAVTAGLAFVPREAVPGTPLVAVRADGVRATCTVHALPFVRRHLDFRATPTWIPMETA